MSKLNLNTASISDLLALRGMDSATAFYIWRLRRLREIESWADLSRRLGLSTAMIDSLRSQCVIERCRKPCHRPPTPPPA